MHARNGKEWLEKMVRGPVVKDARHPAHETIVLETVQIIYRSRRIECDFDRPSFFDSDLEAIWGFFLGENRGRIRSSPVIPS